MEKLEHQAFERTMNFGTILLVLVGWASLFYRIHAEEKVLSQHPKWPAYVALVRYRLFPGLW